MTDSIHIRPEPVAWMYERNGKVRIGEERSEDMLPAWTETPLYTAPQGSEREAIVAWLRSQATCGCKGAHGRCLEDDPPLGFADAIERGDHLPPPPTDNGGE